MVTEPEGTYPELNIDQRRQEEEKDLHQHAFIKKTAFHCLMRPDIIKCFETVNCIHLNQISIVVLFLIQWAEVYKDFQGKKESYYMYSVLNS